MTAIANPPHPRVAAPIRATTASALLAFACIAGAPLPGAQAPEADGEERFLRKLQTAVDHAAAARYPRARDTLNEALKEHERAAYVQARYPEIVDLAKRCDYNLACPEITAKDVLSGELLSFDDRRGRMKIRYKADHMDDWKRTMDGGALYHPALFKGPHKITVKGDSYPDNLGAIVAVCCYEGAGYAVRFGREEQSSGSSKTWVPATIFDAGANGDLDKKEISPCRSGRPYTIEVSITATGIRAIYNGRSLLAASKPKDAWGHIQIGMPLSFDEIVMEGDVEPFWIQNMVDARTNEQLAGFTRSWTPGKALPPWVGEKPNPGRPLLPIPSPVLDKPMTRQQDFAAQSIAASMDQGEYEGARRLLGRHGPEFPAPVRLMFETELKRRAGDIDGALALIDRALAANPKIALYRQIRAEILAESGRTGEAIDTWAELIVQFPGEAELHESVAECHVEARDLNAAYDAIIAARKLGIDSPRLNGLYTTILRARNGPPWSRRYQVQTANYRVVTDINEATAKQYAEMLENSLLSYQNDLEWVKPDRRGQRHDVLLFSGQAGYAAYCEGLWGTSVPHTAGLYAHGLGQLLIWNIPVPEEMSRTVRHEGFHQYLHSVMRDPPIWFDEGLAGYYESAERRGGRWHTGVLRQDYLKTIESNAPWHLRDFLHADRKAFMARAALAYPQSWAVIHFLRQGNRDKKLLFKQFFEAFRDRAPASTAQEEVLGGIDLDLLDREFREFLKGSARSR